jgi:hypothetical protein
MSKIQLRLGVAVVATALVIVASAVTANNAQAGEPVGYPQPSEWDALYDYFEAIAANERNAQPATDESVAPSTSIEAPAPPPAAPVEAPAAPTASQSAPSPGGAVLLPSTGAGPNPGGTVPAIAAALIAMFGGALVSAACAARTESRRST